ncbi:MAG: trigger factor [Gammaproteobacteria bacterium]|nr:trigger factor [Gammaproteobacteria bacterium]
MNINVTKTDKLERKMQLEVPHTEVAAEENKRLQKLSKTVRLDGFRKGKIPLKEVAKRFGAQVRQEVIGDLIQKNVVNAFQQISMDPASRPNIEEISYKDGEPLRFTAVFEVYPEVKLKPFEKVKVEKFQSSVTDADVTHTIDAIRKQYCEWEAVSRKSKLGDQVEIDFEGSVKGEKFEGGTAKNFKMELGASRMIPGFEDDIIGMKATDEKTITVKFPKDYSAENLAGKKAEFVIKMHKVEEARLPLLDDAFAEKLGVKGGVDALKKEVRDNMERELEQAIKAKLKKQVVDALYELNDFDVPKSMVHEEIHVLQKQAEERFGQKFPEADLHGKVHDMFDEEAKKRVALGLIFSNIIKEHSIKADPTRVRQFVERLADAYEKPQEIVAMYYSDKNRLANVEALMLEEQLVEKVLESAKVSNKKVAFSDVIKTEK